MQFHPDTIPYLKGDSYDGSHKVRYLYASSDMGNLTRLDVLQDLARNKNIVHIGFVDHSIRKLNTKIKYNKWLHKLLVESAQRCVGVDIVSEPVAYVRDVLGYSDVFTGDILTDELPEVMQRSWDAIFLPEVIEHLPNPVNFLTRLRSRFQNSAPQLIVSTPNTLSPEFNPTTQTEIINSDHCYLFSPYTLARIGHLAGYQVENITMCMDYAISRRNIIQKWRMRRRPLERPALVMTFRPENADRLVDMEA